MYSCMMDRATSYNITGYRIYCLGVAVSVMRICYCFSNILILYKYMGFMTYPWLQFHFPRNNCIMIHSLSISVLFDILENLQVLPVLI